MNLVEGRHAVLVVIQAVVVGILQTPPPEYLRLFSYAAGVLLAVRCGPWSDFGADCFSSGSCLVTWATEERTRGPLAVHPPSSQGKSRRKGFE